MVHCSKGLGACEVSNCVQCTVNKENKEEERSYGFCDLRYVRQDWTEAWDDANCVPGPQAPTCACRGYTTNSPRGACNTEVQDLVFGQVVHCNMFEYSRAHNLLSVL